MSGKLNKTEGGLVKFTEWGTDKVVCEVATVQCVHCGGHFQAPRFGPSMFEKRSRIGRGWCMNCNGYICGAGCLNCVPTEQLLENYEKGRPLDFRPIIVSVGS